MKHIPRYTAPTKLPSFIAVCFCALALAFTQHSALAQSWSGATDFAWGDGSNWSPSGVPADDSPLTFGTASGYTVDLGGVSRAVGNLTFTNGANYTLQNGTLTLASGAGINTTAAGATIINANLTLPTAATISGNATLNGVITSSTFLNVASTGETVTISGSAQNALTGSFSIQGGTVIVDKSAGTALAQQRAIGNNLIFLGGNDGKLVYTNQAGSLGRISLQRDGTIEAAEGFSVTGTGTGNYIRFRPGYKLTLNTYSNAANIDTWIELDGGFSIKTGSIELETLSNVNFNQVDRGIRNNSPGGDGVLSLIKSGAGTLTYASTVVNSYTGSTTLKGGTLSMGNIAQLGDSGNDATNLVFSGGTLEYTGVTASSARGFTVQTGSSAISVTNGNATLTFSGDLTGGGELVKKGDGALLISGNGSARTGATKITGGTLILDGTLGGNTEVSAGGTIAGSGTVRSLAVASGGTLSPGDSPGTLYGIDGAAWQADGNYNWQVAALNTDANDQSLAGDASGWDLFSVTGVLNLDGLDTVNDKFNINLWTLSALPDTSGPLAGFDPFTVYTWKITEATEIQLNGIALTTNTDYSDYFNINTLAINGTDGWAGEVPADIFRIVTLDDGNALYLQAIPEPSPAVMVLIAAAGFLFMRRSRRSR